MTAKGDDGVPLRVHLERTAEGLFDTPEKLEAVAKLEAEPSLPAILSPLWAIFLELHLRRPQMEFGPVRLPWSELEAYSRQRRRGVPLKPWQLNAIFEVEDAYFEIRAKNEAALNNKSGRATKTNER